MQIKVTLPKTGPYLGWRIASIVVMGAMCGSIIVAAYFMYQNIYRVLDDANTIVVLNASSGSDNIDLETFAKAQNLVSSKASIPPIPNSLRDIFNFAPTSTPHATPPITNPTSTSTTSSKP